MRIDLTTTYPERETAKALGARWDAFKRVWYVIDPTDLAPFLHWIPSAGAFNPGAPTKASEFPHFKKTKKKQRHDYGTTVSAFVAHCGCTNVLPWEDCIHTLRAGEVRQMISFSVED